MRDTFFSFDWNSFLRITDPNDLLVSFNEILKVLHEDFFPLKWYKPRDNLWYNNDIELAIVNRNIAYNNWKRNKTTDLHNIYKRLRNRVNETIKHAKENYERRIINTNVPSKQLWKNIKKLGVTKTSSTHKSCEFSPTDINNFFASNFTSDDTPYDGISGFSNDDGFRFRQVEEFEVVNAVFSISSNAIGLDEIPIKFVKIILPLALSYITHIFNSIFLTSIFLMHGNA